MTRASFCHDRQEDRKDRSREVWWCWIVNEPVIVDFPNGYKQCGLCEMNLEDSETLHEFLLHLHKPQDKVE